MDVRMPGLDGIEAAKKIQENRQSPIPVIFLTGMSGLPRSAIPFPHLFMSKPFEPEALARCIQQLN
jgi:CheY-like chemotaxis protein